MLCKMYRSQATTGSSGDLDGCGAPGWADGCNWFEFEKHRVFQEGDRFLIQLSDGVISSNNFGLKVQLISRATNPGLNLNLQLRSMEVVTFRQVDFDVMVRFSSQES